MNMQVYLIDDNDSMKHVHVDAFIEFLNQRFASFTFTKGRMKHGGKEVDHTSVFARYADQIDSVLQDHAALILLDLTFVGDPYVRTADELRRLHPEVAERARYLGTTLARGKRTVDRELDLASVIMAIAEITGARIALVTSMSPQEVYQNLNDVPLGKTWFPWIPDSWEGASRTIEILDELVTRHYMNDVIKLRNTWKEMGDAAKDNRWVLEGDPGQPLFPGTGRYVKYHCVEGHLNNKNTLRANAAGLTLATESFVRALGVCLKSSEERISVLKAATRNRQIPLFLGQRILGLKEVQDLTSALSWWNQKGSRDAAAVCSGLQSIGVAAKKEARGTWSPLVPTLEVTSDRAKVSVKLRGTIEEIVKAREAVGMGAARRASQRDRNGPGDLTLAIELLGPTAAATVEDEGREMRITKDFSKEAL